MVRHVKEMGADLVENTREATGGREENVPGPSTNPMTNILLADLMIRAGSYVMRDAIERGMLRGRYGRETAREMIKNKSLGQQAISFALAKVATRSLPGALLVGGGALAKTIFDRSQKRRKSRRKGDRALIEQAHSDE
ncbi:hypothetical protein [Qipengyuania huizhouensis]|uniref:hypothetical protein n=1 Tax=Qipengyuania huizhouensis TaxID=2867245 RepID=UPI001C868579|nr:hypothetical protein [Qipengyuania huizhouensis]MBX7459766.1 hypothetical protein [Qipengyuania huizhouensis]